MDELNQIAEASYLPILMLTGDDDAGGEARSALARRQGLPEQAVPQRRSAAPDRHAARDAVPLSADPESEPDARSEGAGSHARARGGADRDHRAARAAPRSFATTTPASTPSASARWRRCSRRQIGLPDAQVVLIRRAAPLHDVGKIGIPDSILLKLGKLTADEFELVKTHTTIGARILSGSRFTILRLAEEIAFNHHERWDGDRLRGLARRGDPARRTHRRGRRRVRRA